MTPTPGRKGSVDTSAIPSGSSREGSFLRSAHAHPPPQKLRRGSTASSIHSIHSIGGSLDTASTLGNNTVIELGQNAISTLLQPPIVRTGLQPLTAAPVSSAHRPPTSRDIPPVTLTNIPHVDPSEFKPYIAQVGALYERLQRVRENEEEAANGSANRRSSKLGADWADGHDEGHLKPSPRMPMRRKGSTASLASISSLDSPGLPKRTGPGYMRRPAQGPPPLSTIPNVYYEEDFHLENPRTFDIVSERSEVVQQPQGAASQEKKVGMNGSAAAPRKALATNAILQEKLSWYMDTIEMHLINSISTASTTFFSALGSLRELHTEAAESVERIKVLRQDLQALDEEIATTGLDIMQKRQRMANMQQLNDAVLQLKRIADGVVQTESFVDAGEVEKALENIDSLEALIAGEREVPTKDGILSLAGPRLIDLRGASALQSVNGDIETLRFRIGKAYETKFQTILMEDLRRHVSKVSQNEVLMRWSSAAQRAKGGQSRLPSIFPTYMEGTDSLRAEIVPCILGLAKARYITLATTLYREAILREVRNIIRRPLPSSNDDDNESMISASTTSGGRNRSNQEKSTVLARNLRALSPEDAEEMLSGIYIKFTEAIRRVTTQVKVLLDVASSLAGGGSGLKSPPIRSPLASPNPDRYGNRDSAFGFEIQEELHLAIELPKLLGQAVDVAHEKIAKILRVRAEQTKSLSLGWFLRYYTLNLLFVNECEAISGQSGTTLKTLVTTHIKDFVRTHGDSENVKLAQGMDSDQWVAKDFTDADTELLNDVLACSTNDPASWTNRTTIWQPYEGDEEEAEKEEVPLETNGDRGAKEKARVATIDSEAFMLPNSGILCLRGMTNFLYLISGIPLLTSDIATTLIAFFQLFNSRCTQLILGAGATRSAGLKNIAAKHLALASRALAFIATLIPHIREFVRRNLGSGSSSNVMGEFDKVRHLMQEHQSNIYQKLVEIMRGRAGAAVREMRKVDWDSPGQAPTAVHAYVESLSRDTTTLHRVLTRHLPVPPVQMIMIPVFESYKEQFGKALQEATASTDAGRASMIRDVEYIISKISRIDCFGDTGDYLLGIARSKEVRPAASSPVPNTAAASPSLAPQPESTQARLSSDGRPNNESNKNSPRVSGEGQ